MFDAGSQWFVLINIAVSVIIDLKIIQRRKWVCVFCCFFAALVNAVLIWSDSLTFWFWAFTIDGFLGNFRCTIFNAWIVEQARKDVKYGAGDFSSFMGIAGQLGGASGTILATVMIDHNHARNYFIFSGICQLVMLTAAFFVDAEVDTNEFVSSKDPCLQHYER